MAVKYSINGEYSYGMGCMYAQDAFFIRSLNFTRYTRIQAQDVGLLHIIYSRRTFRCTSRAHNGQ